MENDSTITAETMAEKLKKDISTVKKAIKTLKEKKVLSRVGSDKTGTWEILRK